VKSPVAIGGALRASRFHPTAPEFLVVAQPNSDKFLATMPIANANFIESVKPKYELFMSRNGGRGNPFFNSTKKKVLPATQSAPLTSPTVNKAKLSPDNDESSDEMLGSAPIVTGRAKSPQKSSNLLDSVPAKSVKKVDTSDHGPNCVCRDCRTKKMGKGGSLFPDL
jgi:hypothetical protein